MPGANVLERVERLLSGRFDADAMQRRLDRVHPPTPARPAGRCSAARLSYGAAQDDDGRLEAVRRRQRQLLLELPAARAARARVEAAQALGQAGRDHGVRHVHVQGRSAARRARLGRDRLRAESRRGSPRPGAQRAHAGRLHHAGCSRSSRPCGLGSATVYNSSSRTRPTAATRATTSTLRATASSSRSGSAASEPTAGWHWEPKEAFHAVARHFGRAVDSRALRLS